MEQEIPDYDLDSEDESWLQEQSKKMEISPLKFEEMMDRLEKGSGQQVTFFFLFKGKLILIEHLYSSHIHSLLRSWRLAAVLARSQVSHSEMRLACAAN
jgi:enhancer of polycomb-like protein